ncbi:hypothetical protein IV203_038441 [Nitzschia inconspicua]|uniref:Uncharacterized protein n=1 Tax=Nitzschia inconspicua TaxID=303405 RepID=A0A9K3LNW5_9STRA|nr:hypothetical protein IV203_001318 [Nitzschia inconspicua]KAG7365238.1 hypothetical protein IV203_038441 [Nitzschia inconspicua]
MPPDPFTGIPADIQAFRDGWTEITDHGHPYEVVLARDFSDDYLAERICGTFRNMGDKVTSSLVSLGKEVSRASILELLLGDVAIVRLEQFTTEKPSEVPKIFCIQKPPPVHLRCCRAQ